MSKVIVLGWARKAVLVAMFGALPIAWLACTTTNDSTPTGCVAYRPDAGTTGAQCAVEWSCNSGSQHYQIICDLVNDNYACTCSTDTTTLERTITVNPFPCDLNGGALVGANSCGYMLEM